MECIWRLFRYRQPHGYRYQPHPPVFYIHITANNGLSHYYLYDFSFLEKYEKVCESSKEKSMVLFVKTPYPDLSLKRKAICAQPLRPHPDLLQRRKPSTHSPGLSKSFTDLNIALILNAFTNCNEYSAIRFVRPQVPFSGFRGFYINSFSFSITASTSSFVLCLLNEKRTVTRLGLLLIARITWLP